MGDAIQVEREKAKGDEGERKVWHGVRASLTEKTKAGNRNANGSLYIPVPFSLSFSPLLSFSPVV